MTDSTVIPTGKILYTTKAGLTLTITPPTLTARNAVLSVAVRTFPDPDPAQFSKPTGVQTLSGSVAMTDGRESDEYKHAITLVALQRRDFIETAMIDSFVQIFDIPRDKVIETYREELTRIRKYTTGLPENDWEAVFKTFLVDHDELLVIKAALSKNLPLTQEEIAEGRKFFRLVLPGADIRRTSADSESPGTGAA